MRRRKMVSPLRFSGKGFAWRLVVYFFALFWAFQGGFGSLISGRGQTVRIYIIKKRGD
jgi:hypothetical protein